MSTTSLRLARTVVEVAAPVAMSGGEFLSAAQQALGIWGGMSSSIQRNNELEQLISFDPATATDGLAGVIRWLDSMDVEYTLTLSRWTDES